MPHSKYRANEVGTLTCLTPAPAAAGAYVTLRFRFTAGRYGIDDAGGLKLSWRQTSDMGKPQVSDPAGAGFARIEAGPDRHFVMEVSNDNIRPYKSTLTIRMGRFLMPGESFDLILGCKDQGGPGIRMQTNAELNFPFKAYVDAFSTCDFAELDVFPIIDILPGPVESYRLVLPLEIPVGSTDTGLRVVGLDRWGNPSSEHLTGLTLATTDRHGEKPEPFVPDAGLVTSLRLPVPGADEELRTEIRDSTGKTLGRSNPALGVAAGRPLPLWADLHGQSGETVGAGTIAEYYAFADGPGLLDATCHQGNDFQLTDAYWAEINRVSKLHDEPGRFIALPGYEWSGNTAVGGDHNVICLNEGETIYRSSAILLPEGSYDPSTDAPMIEDLFAALDPEHYAVLAHVGGRYAKISPEDDLSLQHAVEVHSCWGTFEWILHDSFAVGHRVGIVAHSDDHKNRPGCAYPGASRFGALGGLTCYLAESFDRKGLIDALRQRHTFGTTGDRIRIDLGISADGASFRLHQSPYRSDTAIDADALTMGDIAFTDARSIELAFDVGCPDAIEKIELFDGTDCIDAWHHPFSAPAEDDRIRILAEGALYRGRGRIINWAIDVATSEATVVNAETINVFNRDRIPVFSADNKSVRLETVTTGNRSGMDLTLSNALAGNLKLKCDLGELDLGLADLGPDTVSELTGEGLGRRISVQRRPKSLSQSRVKGAFVVDIHPGSERKLYLRITQDNGHVAWTSPAYIEGAPKS